MATTFVSEFRLKQFGFTDCSAQDFYVSQWGNSKIIFLVFRAILFLYWTSWVVVGTVEYTGYEGGWRYYVYLSHWDEWLIVLSFGLSLGIVIYGYSETEFDEGDLSWFHKLSWATRSASITIAYVVTILFWTLVKTTDRASTAVNVHRHALNSVLVTVDLLLSRVPVRLLHFIYPMAIGVLYTLFTVILHTADVQSSFYTNTLDWAKVPKTSIIVCVLACFVATPLLHCLTFGIYHLRAFISKKLEDYGHRKVETRTEQINPAYESFELGGEIP